MTANCTVRALAGTTSFPSEHSPNMKTFICSEMQE